MDSSRGLVASIAALGLVVAAAITLLVISGAPLDFRDWPHSPKPRPVPRAQGEVLGERADSGGAETAPALVQLGTSAPRFAAGGGSDALPGRSRATPVSKVSPRRRERQPFRPGRGGPSTGQPPSTPPPGTTPPSVPVSVPVTSPEPPWSNQWEENAKTHRPSVEPEGPGHGHETEPKPWPKPDPRPEPEPGLPPVDQPDAGKDEGKGEEQSEGTDEPGGDESNDRGKSRVKRGKPVAPASPAPTPEPDGGSDGMDRKSKRGKRD